MPRSGREKEAHASAAKPDNGDKDMNPKPKPAKKKRKTVEDLNGRPVKVMSRHEYEQLLRGFPPKGW